MSGTYQESYNVGRNIPSVQNSKMTFTSKLLIGATSGVFGSSCFYPIDTIKVHLQTRAAHTGESLFVATAQTAKFIYARGGVREFYRGFGACLWGIAPEKAMKLAVNDYMRDILEKKYSKLTTYSEMFAGAVAGFTQLFVTVPYEMVKIKMQTQGPRNRLTAPQIINRLGFFGLYRGYTATFLRDVPFCLIFFPVYSNIKEVMSPAGGNSNTFSAGLVSGMVSGAIASASVTPADMLKTRIQRGDAGGKHLFELAADVVQKEGIFALYRGWHTRVMVIAPMYAIVSVAFELQKRYWI